MVSILVDAFSFGCWCLGLNGWCWLGFSGVGLSFGGATERVREVDKEERYELLIYVILLGNLYYHNELYVKIRHGMWGVLLNGLLK